MMAHTDSTEQILRRNLVKVAAEQKYYEPDIKVSPVSTEGANYTSDLFKATISSRERDDLQLFAKVAMVSETFRSQAPMRVFDVERIFYKELAQKYQELEEGHKVPEEHRFKYPKTYTIDSTLYEETVVMEDLTKEGYTLHNRFKSVDWEYASAAFTEVAKMHALSLALRLENPEDFQRYSEEFKFQFDMFEGAGGDMKKMMEQGMQNTLSVTKEEYKDRLMKYLEDMMDNGGIETFKTYYQPSETPVIRHGDFRPSNIMHKVTEEGKLDVVVVDYQTLIAGNPVIDLLYFIFLGTDKSFREQHYDQLLQHYHEQLGAALERLGQDVEEVYTRAKFLEDIKENLPYGLLISLNALVLVTVDPADAPSQSKDQDIMSFMQMKPSSVFAVRVNEIFEDYIQWGIL